MLRPFSFISTLLLSCSLGISAEDAPYNKATDPLIDGGNLAPKIEPISPEREQKLMESVEVADGFEISLFAAPPSFNYPVFIAAAPNGDLYVSSDGNGSEHIKPNRGRIVRLRDTDHDGRADETIEFVKDLDAPRGLLWDHDRLYVVHPPNLTAFIDADGDGIAEKQETLVEGIGWDYSERRADHGTNGLSMGVDGYLYVALGDFAVMNAVGSDGTKLQHRNGGVLRVRPDGSGLEVYATGTRNILEVAISPEMEMFTRDNTNDGGGWNIRFHHHTGHTDHGYPRLYKNFGDEIIQPLADYGGGSGCGAVYIDEPGFAKFNDAPFTADWGKSALFHHALTRNGATFKETQDPTPFIKAYRCTDADVDALSNVYLASWKGATFGWEGPDVGFIVQARPIGFTPEVLPDFPALDAQELLTLYENASYRRRLAAQRELIRRGLPDEIVEPLTKLASDPTKPIAHRTLALFSFIDFPEKASQLHILVKNLDPQPEFDAVYARFLAENAPRIAKENKGSFTFPNHWKDQPATLVQLNRLISNSTEFDDNSRRSVFDITLAHKDPVVTHTAIHALAELADEDLALSYITPNEIPELRKNALQALARMHTEAAVSGLIQRLDPDSSASYQQEILKTLARLHFHEGEWKGDSWGTRPDTRGPYYQPEPWEQTDRIMAVLKEALASEDPQIVSSLVREMNRNRIKSNDALNRVLALAKNDPKLLPEATAQLAEAEDIPLDAIPSLIRAALTSPNTLEDAVAATLLENAVTALTKTDSSDGFLASLTAIQALKDVFGSERQQNAAETAFFNAERLENHHRILEQQASKQDGSQSIWADAALLTLSARTSGSPESREASKNALIAGWEHADRRAQILEAVALIKHNPYADKVLSALDDPDPKVLEAAKKAAKQLRIKKKSADDGPLIATLKNPDVIAEVMKTKGDPALGEQLFIRASCTACHTVNESEKPKGPYLGNISQTYPREVIAKAILEPNDTISQGFMTNVITATNGDSKMGFVIAESADEVTLRDITGQDHIFKTADIKDRTTPPISMMPPGLVSNMTVKDFAALLDYIESLAE